MLVDSVDWLGTHRVAGEGAVRLSLLDDDVRSVQIAFCEFNAIMDGIVSTKPEPHLRRTVELFHHAKVFICAMRRVGRLADALSANRTIFGPGPSRQIKLAWQKKRSLFERYVEPRNAIEHIDEEIKGKTNWVVLNLHDNELFVTDTKSAVVSAQATQAAVDLRNEIVSAVTATSTQGAA